MRRNIITIFIKLFSITLLFFISFHMTYAMEEEKYYSPLIPIELPHVQKIEFVDNNHFIIKEGFLEKDYVFKYMDMSDKTMSEFYPYPFKGMVVTYGEDSQVNQIIDSNGKEVESITQEMKVISTYSLDDRNNNILKHQWGSAPNKLYWNTYYKCYYGYGRATAFGEKKEDAIGQRNHKLKKGDVATSLKYDNIACGKTVVVTAKHMSTKKEVTHKMTKWDAGGMPNAIVDIWKDGVTYWGGNPQKLNNFAINNVVIQHD